MYLSAINHGITRLPQNLKFNGVTLNSEQRNRFIQLYANDIKIDGKNMVDTLLDEATELLNDVERLRIDFPFGEAQDIVNSTVSEFRAAARARMFGDFTTDKVNRSVTLSTRGVGSKLGLGGDRIEYPETAEKMRLEKSMRIFEPR